MQWIAVFLGFLRVLSAAPIEKIMVDMTHVYDQNSKTYPTFGNFSMSVVMNGTIGTSWVQGEEISAPTHIGTHMDSPSHFVPGGLDIDQITISELIAPAAVINIKAKAAVNPDAEITIEDLEKWERITGQSLNGTIVLMNSGWAKKYPNRAAYTGTPDWDHTKLHFPGFSAAAAQWLVDYRDIKGIGSDTLTFDVGPSRDFPVHNIILGKGLFGLENVANVEKIPIYGAMLHVLPMKIGRASGAPTRIIATFPKVIYDQEENTESSYL